MRIAIICFGNIARSQILAAYLEHYAARLDLSKLIEIRSCGTVEQLGCFGNEAARLHEVQERLRERGLNCMLERTLWADDVANWVASCDLILIADEARRCDVVGRLGEAVSARAALFYEFIDEGTKDFTDTFDFATGEQDAERFDRCFDELERIAVRTLEKLRKMVET